MQNWLKYKERKQAYNKKYYEENKEHIKMKTKTNVGSGNGEQVNRLKAKRKCKELAYNECELCYARDTKLDVHHVIPVEEGGTDDQDNLVCLCRHCHKVIHAGNKYYNYMLNEYLYDRKRLREAEKRTEEILKNKIV